MNGPRAQEAVILRNPNNRSVIFGAGKNRVVAGGVDPGGARVDTARALVFATAFPQPGSPPPATTASTGAPFPGEFIGRRSALWPRNFGAVLSGFLDLKACAVCPTCQ